MAEQGHTLEIDIVSAEGQVHAGRASMVFAPAVMGEVGILPKHSPLLTLLNPGQVKIEDDKGETESFFVSGGILEVQPYMVTVLCDTVERAHEIDAAQARAAKQRAEEAVSCAGTDLDLARAQAELAEAAARLHLVKNLRGASR